MNELADGTIRAHPNGLGKTQRIVIFILLLAFIIRILGITRESIWLDEAMTGLRSQMNLWDLIENISPKDHLPLYFVSIWILEKIAGNSELVLRLPSAVLGALTVIPVFFIGSRFSRRVGIMAAFLTAINPSLIYYSQEARMYAPMAFLAALSLYYSFEMIKPSRISKKHAIFGLVITNTVLFYLHYFSAIFIAVETLSIFACDLIMNRRRIRKESILMVLPNIISFIIFLPWLSFILIRYPFSGHTTGGGLELSPFLLYATYFFLGGTYKFYYELEFGIPFIASLWMLIAAILGTIYLTSRGSRDKVSRRMWIFFIPMLVVPTLSVYIISYCWQSIYNYRYFIFIMPALVIMSSLGIDYLLKSITKITNYRELLRIMIILFIPLFLLTADVFMFAREDKSDWRGATLHIENNLGDDDIILPQPAHQRYTMYYYAPDLPIRSISANPTNVTELFEDHEVIWLVTYQYRDLDYFGFIDLLNNRTVEKIEGFSGLNVWRFSR